MAINGNGEKGLNKMDILKSLRRNCGFIEASGEKKRETNNSMGRLIKQIERASKGEAADQMGISGRNLLVLY